MSLSKKHQEYLDRLYPEGYEHEIKIKTVKGSGKVVDEHDFFHVLFAKFFPIPKSDVNHVDIMVQIFGTKDWEQTRATIEKRGLGITGYDEYGIVHDPIKWKAAKKAEEEAEAKKAETKRKAAETKAKNAAAKEEVK